MSETCMYCDEWRSDLNTALNEITRLNAIIAENEDDAKRYRWLKSIRLSPDQPAIYADDDCNTWLTEDYADRAIDEAMRVKGE